MASVWCTCCSTISSVVPDVADRLERAVHLVDDDRRETERQLVGDQQARLLHEHPRERQHALLTARQRARQLRAPLAEPREQRVRLVERAPRTPARPAAAPERELEVLLDRERREHRAALGRVHDAELARNSNVCRPVTSLPSKSTCALRGRDQARRRRVRSSSCPSRWNRGSRARRPAGTDERHAEDRAERSVAGVDVAQLERARRAAARRRRPAIRRCPRGRPCAPRCRRTPRRSAPDAMSVPKSSTYTRSTKLRTRSTSCSTSRIAMPCSLCTLSSVRSSSAVSARSRPDDGSSRSTSLRLRHQRPADLDEAPDAEAQRLDRPIRDRLETEQVEHRLRARLLLGRRAAPMDARPSTARPCRCGCGRR